MAKRRDIKKDINHLTYQVINECYTFIDYSPDVDYENVMDIILEAVDLRNDLIYRLNHVENKGDKKAIKSHFNQIIKDLFEKNLEFIERLNSLAK